MEHPWERELTKEQGEGADLQKRERELREGADLKGEGADLKKRERVTEEKGEGADLKKRERELTWSIES